MTPKADFSYEHEQFATCSFVNVNPQFQKFNSANWGELENDVRDYSRMLKKDLKITTGSAEILQLPGRDNKLHSIYIAEENGVEKVPVPLYYWKVLEVDSNTKLAFIGLNFPSKNSKDFKNFAKTTAFRLCPVDRCSESPFSAILSDKLLQNRRSIDDGFIGCCSYEEFKEASGISYADF